MKKNILIALFALLAVALNSNAQNNTYNMIIEMANGTKITIGPNDVKNISFNNGELVMAGEDINSLVEQQSKTDERISSLENVTMVHYNQLMAQIVDLQHHLANNVYNKEEVNVLLKTIQAGSTPDLSNYATKADLQAIITQIAAISTWINSMSQAIENLNQKIDALNSKVDAIQ